MDKKKLVKIGVPILIVLLIAGVWFVKNQESVEPIVADVQKEAAASVPVTTDIPAAPRAVDPVTTLALPEAQVSALVSGSGLAAQNTGDAVTTDPPSEKLIGAPIAANDPNFTLHTEKIDLEVLSAYKLPMILDFGSDDCIPCKEMAPVLKAMNTEMQGKAIIRFVDVWKYTNGADGFPIQVIPTQVLVTAEGKPYVPSEEMQSSGIRFTMYSMKDTNEHVFTVHQGGLTEEQMRLILKDMGVV